MKTWILLILIALVSCKPGQKSKEFNPEAVRLNDSAVQLAIFGDSIRIKKAIALLDQAIAIQADYALAYKNKMIYQNELGLSEDAFESLQKLEALEPANPDHKVLHGIYLENTGDKLNARQKYISADSLYRIILDTLSPRDLFQSVKINRATNLRLLNKEKEADELFQDVKKNLQDTLAMPIIDTLSQKSRTEILEYFRINQP